MGRVDLVRGVPHKMRKKFEAVSCNPAHRHLLSTSTQRISKTALSPS